MPMAGRDFSNVVDEEPSGPNVVALFLALFLLILAFFILLVTISTLEEVKSEAVKKSLTSTFTSIFPPISEPARFQSKEGNILAGQRFQRDLTDIFSTAIQVSRVEIVHPGRLMRIWMPARALFYDNETRVRRELNAVLDRVVANISARPRGLRFDMEFIVSVPPLADGALPTTQTLDIARAGAFAREMIAKGAPRDGVSIGMESGDTGQVVIYFYIRPEEETRLNFERLGGQTPAAASGDGKGQ